MIQNNSKPLAESQREIQPKLKIKNSTFLTSEIFYPVKSRSEQHHFTLDPQEEAWRLSPGHNCISVSVNSSVAGERNKDEHPTEKGRRQKSE